MAAAANRHELIVSRRPRVVLLATGDEIAAPGAAADGDFAIPDSLSAAIELLCCAPGATPVSKARLPDDPDAIANASCLLWRSQRKQTGFQNAIDTMTANAKA